MCRLLIIALLAILLAPAAHAMRVRNADDVPHTVTLRYFNDVQQVTLPPNGSINRRFPGLVVAFGDRSFHTLADQEYLIHNGVMTLNRRNCCGFSRSGR